MSLDCILSELEVDSNCLSACMDLEYNMQKNNLIHMNIHPCSYK